MPGSDPEMNVGQKTGRDERKNESESEKVKTQRETEREMGWMHSFSHVGVSSFFFLFFFSISLYGNSVEAGPDLNIKQNRQTGSNKHHKSD